ncbi:MAG TPA: RNA polymerase sigma factor, partial [Thermomonospora sp.]|nr:RNA polymerase sigma factor [Thermomonospora sp.]
GPRRRSRPEGRAPGAGVRRGRRRAPGAFYGGVDPALARHVDECADCGRRDRVTAAALLELAPVPVLPAALRHRVVHTATDPELAGHRADIAARGGGLTPEGMPRQPDVPSTYTRRWLFVGGGAAGALLTALAAIMMMSPVSSDIRFPFDPRPQPSIGDVRQEASDGRHSGGPAALAPPGSRPGDPQGPVPPSPHNDGPHGGQRPWDPSVPPAPAPLPPNGPRPPSPSPSPKPTPGKLTVGPATVVLDREGATITLKAELGPVGWTAQSDDERLTVSHTDGTLAAGTTFDLRVEMKERPLIVLPGEGTITVVDRQGVRHEVKVTWKFALG